MPKELTIRKFISKVMERNIDLDIPIGHMVSTGMTSSDYQSMFSDFSIRTIEPDDEDEEIDPNKKGLFLK